MLVSARSQCFVLILGRRVLKGSLVRGVPPPPAHCQGLEFKAATLFKIRYPIS